MININDAAIAYLASIHGEDYYKIREFLKEKGYDTKKLVLKQEEEKTEIKTK